MSQENVEIVRSFYEAWARDEVPGPMELMDADIEYVNPEFTKVTGYTAPEAIGRVISAHTTAV